MHVQHTFLHIVVRADDSLRTKISWLHFGRFPFTHCAHAKVTKFVANCAPFARERENSTEKVSLVKFSFSMVNEVMIQPD